MSCSRFTLDDTPLYFLRARSRISPIRARIRGRRSGIDGVVLRGHNSEVATSSLMLGHAEATADPVYRGHCVSRPPRR